MPGEPILVVDDTPVNLKLTRILLINEGYKVLTAANAEEALELLRSYRPHLILADIQLPGIDGLELTRRIKQNESTRDITVIALTAFAMTGDEQKAIDAGCDGYITKPIDTRSLGARIREFLDRRPESRFGPAAALSPASESGMAPAELHALRRQFLQEGQERARQILLELDGQFDPVAAARSAHQWIGAAGLLGYSAISRLARETEALLLEKPLDNAQLRESLTNLALAFTSPREARDIPVADSIVRALTGKRVALVGLPANEAQRMCVALERAGAVPEFLQIADAPDCPAARDCQIAVVHVRPETFESPWLVNAGAMRERPLLLVGSRDDLLELEQPVQSRAREFLMDSWEPEEALVRLSLAIAHRDDYPETAPPAERRPAPANGRVQVVIADDDPTVLALVRTSLQNFGMDCHTATDGRSAIDAIRRARPQAAVLDVNMPGMDGYEVLAAIRSEELPIRVLLLTARQQESDVIRGFTLGADDYVVKPFSPMELVARLKRLVLK
ncbi:MAG TPA: response regulator [Bryobacteraceae bacterium]|jgi:DNA-binding response OmpR family regulator